MYTIHVSYFSTIRGSYFRTIRVSYFSTIRVSDNSVSVYSTVCGHYYSCVQNTHTKVGVVHIKWLLSYIAYYPGPTVEFTGSSIGHNYLRKNGMNLPIVALNRSLRDLSIGV